MTNVVLVAQPPLHCALACWITSSPLLANCNAFLNPLGFHILVISRSTPSGTYTCTCSKVKANSCRKPWTLFPVQGQHQCGHASASENVFCRVYKLVLFDKHCSVHYLCLIVGHSYQSMLASGSLVLVDSAKQVIQRRPQRSQTLPSPRNSLWQDDFSVSTLEKLNVFFFVLTQFYDGPTHQLIGNITSSVLSSKNSESSQAIQFLYLLLVIQPKK